MSADDLSRRPSRRAAADTRDVGSPSPEADQAAERLDEELSHRIKNVFAVVSALTALSAREHPEAQAFAASLRGRIAALAQAHEFVRPHIEWWTPGAGDMTLHAFLRALFQPYRDEAGVARVLISGEDVGFDDQAATPVALLFHELATNAARHGALSLPEGRVHLATGHRRDRFVLSWSESGGPPVAAPPEALGFGSRLAALSVEGQLGGRLTRDWRPEGLVVVADLPRAALRRRQAAVRASRK